MERNVGTSSRLHERGAVLAAAAMATAALVNGAHHGGYAVDRVMFPVPAYNETAANFNSTVLLA